MNSTKLLRQLTAILARLAEHDEHCGESEVMLRPTAAATCGTVCIRHDPHTTPEPTIVTLDLPQTSRRSSS